MAKRLSELSLQVYEVVWSLTVPFLRKNRKFFIGFDQRRSGISYPSADLWIHAASAGEAYLAEVILKHLSVTRSISVLITTNTEQGMAILNATLNPEEMAKREIMIHTAYFPLDKPGIMASVVESVKPRLMVLLESELWPGLLFALKTRGCPVVVINGRMRSRSFSRYMLCKSFWKPLSPDRVSAVSESDAERFAALFPRCVVSVMPNIKFDRLTDALESRQSLYGRDSKGLTLDKFVVLASVRREEERPVEKLLCRLLEKIPEAIIGLFPRHMDRIDHWRTVLNRVAEKWLFRTQAATPLEPGTVILWDTFGELTAAYRAASAVFVGGSLAPLGGQNFLEPLCHGLVPVIGPSWENFRWVGNEIIRSGLLRIEPDWKNAADALVEQVKAHRCPENIRARACDYIMNRKGGAIHACSIIETSLQQRATPCCIQPRS